MRVGPIILEICAVLACGCASAPPSPEYKAGNTAANVTTATSLVLEKSQGERRVVRGWPGHPDPRETFIVKVDPKNGGSSHLVLLTADLAAGGEIHAHRHPNADEILILQTGTARVRLGDTVRDVHAGAIVFIPAGTWISLSSLGTDTVSLVAIFSAPGFEDFMRAGSVREGEQNVPMSAAENDQVEKMHLDDVIYKEP